MGFGGRTAGRSADNAGALPEESRGSLFYSGSTAVRRERWNGGMFMKSLALKLHRFLKSEDGPTAVEYAVMLSLIVIVCLSAISTIGTNANSKFQQIASSLK